MVGRDKIMRLVALIPSALRLHLPLLATGIALQVLLLALYATASKLNWYPSRLGSPAEWLDQHFYAIFRPLFSAPIGPPGTLPVFTYFVVLATMFAVYILGVRRAWQIGAGSRASLYIVLGLSALMMMSLLLQPYLSSQDLFSYAFYGHIYGLYGGNPYVAVPRDFPFDPLFDAIFWKDQPSNYGPLWTYMSTLVTLLTGTNTALTLASIKLLVTLFALASVPLVWLILSQTSPQMRFAGTILYAWNPLLILETAGSGHNDSTVGFFILLGLFLYSRNAKLSGLAALVLSVLTKYVSAILIPLFLLLYLRDCTNRKERLVALSKATVVASVLIVVTYLPVYSGVSTFQIASFGTSPSNYINSPLELAFREIRVMLGDSREVASLPLRQRAWWVKTVETTALWAKPDASDSAAIALPDSTTLMVIAPKQGPWLHVYVPQLDEFGYVKEVATSPIPTPNFVGAANAAAAVAQASSHGTNFQRANVILRVSTGAIFLLLLVLLGRKTRTYQDLLYSFVVALFASYWLLQTWFWPWYLIWALPIAALVPHTRVAASIVAFSLTTLGLHAQVDIALLPFIDAFYEYRSLAIFGLPILLVAVWLVFSQLGKRRPSPARLRRRTRTAAFVGALLLVGALAMVGYGAIAGWTQTTSGATSTLEANPPDRSLEWADYYSQGVEFVRENQYKQAVESLTRAIQMQPYYTDAYRARFVAYMHMGLYDEAIDDISTVLAVDGDDLELLLTRGAIYQRLQRQGLALKDFDRAISIDPLESRAYQFKARTYHEMGLVSEGIAAQKRAVALSPYSADLYRELAELQATSRRFEEALSLYNAAIWLDRWGVESYIGRASVLRILGRSDETIPDLREVLVLSNDEDVRTWARRTMAALSGSDGNDQDPGSRLIP